VVRCSRATKRVVVVVAVMAGVAGGVLPLLLLHSCLDYWATPLYPLPHMQVLLATPARAERYSGWECCRMLQKLQLLPLHCANSTWLLGAREVWKCQQPVEVGSHPRALIGAVRMLRAAV
jgi:hypothetical protein